MDSIVVSGSIAYDYLMRFPGRFADHFVDGHMDHVSLSFLVDEMTKHFGGVGANIAYTMALLGQKPLLFGTAGQDFGDYRDHLEAKGVDCSTVRVRDEVFTASFFVNTDLDNNQIASFYAGAMGLALDYTLADVFDGKPDLVLISPNDPVAMVQLSQECRDRGIRFMADPSQQIPRFDGEQLRQCIQGAYIMVVNDYEAEMICKKTGLEMHNLRDMVDVLIITQGERGSEIYDGNTVSHTDIFKTDDVKDPTGVGDAYRAGLVRGLAEGWPLTLCTRMGALCATYALERVGTQNHHFTPAEFVERFRTQYDDEGLLDALLTTDDSVTA